MLRPPGLYRGDLGCELRGIVLVLVLIGVLVGSYALAAPKSSTAKLTAYCSKCSSTRCCTGKRLTTGTVAADLRYHKIGTRIKFGAPLNKTLTVADCGGAIKGPARFDISFGITKTCKCNNFGVKRVPYQVVK